jgi:hypothetical protein
MTRYSRQALYTLLFQRNVREILISNFVKIRPVGAELFRADGQTDTTKQIVAFHNFTNGPKYITTMD